MDYKKIDSVLCDSSSIAPSGCYIEENDLGLAYGCAYKDFLEEVGLKEDDYGTTNLEKEKDFTYCKEQNCNKPNAEAPTTANPIIETTTTPEQDDREKMGEQWFLSSSAQQHKSKIEFFLLATYLTFYFYF